MSARIDLEVYWPPRGSVASGCELPKDLDITQPSMVRYNSKTGKPIGIVSGSGKGIKLEEFTEVMTACAGMSWNAYQLRHSDETALIVGGKKVKARHFDALAFSYKPKAKVA